MSALILSRIILISCAAILLLLLSYIISGLTISWYGLLRVEFGIVIGMYVFTLLGLLVAELLEDKHSESSISNGIFYAIIFLSDSFYPLTEMNTAFGLVVAVNPITPILRFMRDESGWMLPFLIEIVILQTAVFYISKHKIQKR